VRDPGDSLADALAEASFQFVEDIDFTATDPDALLMYYLLMVGYPYPDPFPEDAIFTFSLRLSRGAVRNPKTIAARLRRWWHATN
jgi:hypothetical protein